MLGLGAIGRKVKGLAHAELEGGTAMQSVAQEAFQGIRTVRAFGLEDRMTRQFDGAVQSVRRRGDALARLSALTSPLGEIVGGLMIAVTILVAGLGDSLDFRVLQPLPAKPAWMDAAQMEQVLINLIKNAIESGSPSDEVTLAVAERDGGVAVEVRDRGSGLAPEVLADALLPFYSTKPKGTGLGLTLCREIVDAHGGRLSIANRDGGGAVVTVWIPAAPAAA